MAVQGDAVERSQTVEEMCEELLLVRLYLQPSM
jgi:hypothetical protein